MHLVFNFQLMALISPEITVYLDSEFTSIFYSATHLGGKTLSICIYQSCFP